VFVPWQGLEAGLSLSENRGECAVILRGAGIAALVVSISAGMISNLLFLAAFQFRLDMFLEQTLILGSGAIRAQLLRWAAVLEKAGDPGSTRAQPAACRRMTGGGLERAVA
jgi:hypothetical protein